MALELDILLRAFIALLFAGALGWEREMAGKSAGIRTHMLIGMASALFVCIGELLIRDFQEIEGDLRFDPLRILEAVVTGISFLGAGMIFVASHKQSVKGLTTAAEILVTAAMGILVGLECYILASGVTFLTLMVVYVLNLLFKNGSDSPSSDETG